MREQMIAIAWKTPLQLIDDRNLQDFHQMISKMVTLKIINKKTVESTMNIDAAEQEEQRIAIYRSMRSQVITITKFDNFNLQYFR